MTTYYTIDMWRDLDLDRVAPRWSTAPDTLDRTHEFESDEEAMRRLVAWGAHDAYRMEGDVRVYVVVDGRPHVPVSYAIAETLHPLR
jgi:hypothetical protein